MNQINLKLLLWRRVTSPGDGSLYLYGVWTFGSNFTFYSACFLCQLWKDSFCCNNKTLQNIIDLKQQKCISCLCYLFIMGHLRRVCCPISFTLRGPGQGTRSLCLRACKNRDKGSWWLMCWLLKYLLESDLWYLLIGYEQPRWSLLSSKEGRKFNLALSR